MKPALPPDLDPGPGTGYLQLVSHFMCGVGRDPMKADDERLIADFLRGERAAVEQVEDWLQQAARRYRQALDLPWEDLRQELLLEVTGLLQRGAFRGESRLRPYLWRVASCTCLNLLRDQAWEHRSDPDAAVDRLKAPGSSPLERVLKKESVRELTRLMEAMPECRELWKMILGGKSYRQMSRELGASPGSLRVKVLRCRRKAFALWQKGDSSLRGRHSDRRENEPRRS